MRVGGGGGNFGYILELRHKIHRIDRTGLPSGQYSFINITWLNTDPKAALLHWFTFLKKIADDDTRISFNVVVAVNGENNFIWIHCSFNGPQNEINNLFSPWILQKPTPTSFSIFNYTQTDISRVSGVPFPVVKREHVLSTMAINVTDAMLDVILNDGGA